MQLVSMNTEQSQGRCNTPRCATSENAAELSDAMRLPVTHRAEFQGYDSAATASITNALKLFTKIAMQGVGSEQSHEYEYVGGVTNLAFRLVAHRIPTTDTISAVMKLTPKALLRDDLGSYSRTVHRKFGITLSTEQMQRLRVEEVRPHIERVLSHQADVGAPPIYTEREMLDIEEALWFAHDKFRSVKDRPWGPNESLPMFRHSAEVGLLLACAGEPADVVIAGLLHDFFELYIPNVTSGQMETLIYIAFGTRVRDIVHSITEPPKAPSNENWWQRKTKVLENLQVQGRDENTVACAAKISTMSEGNKHLYTTKRSEDISAWSKGSWDDNREMFAKLRDIFAKKAVPQPLLDRYDLELRRWDSYRP